MKNTLAIVIALIVLGAAGAFAWFTMYPFEVPFTDSPKTPGAKTQDEGVVTGAFDPAGVKEGDRVGGFLVLKVTATTVEFAADFTLGGDLTYDEKGLEKYSIAPGTENLVRFPYQKDGQVPTAILLKPVGELPADFVLTQGDVVPAKTHIIGYTYYKGPAGQGHSFATASEFSRIDQ